MLGNSQNDNEEQEMKKQLTLALVLLANLLLSSVALAGSVDDGKIKIFVSGDPARADEVNGNFSEHTKQINDNSNRISALEAQIAALQSGNTLSISSVKGTYIAHTIEFSVASDGASVLNVLEVCELVSEIILDGFGNFTWNALSGGACLNGSGIESETGAVGAGTYSVDSTGLLTIFWSSSSETGVFRMSTDGTVGFSTIDGVVNPGTTINAVHIGLVKISE